MFDSYGRHIDYLRISVTDRCNLRCIYCMPRSGIESKPPSEILTFEEIAEVASVANEMGIDKIRLTGGEPLARRGVVGLVNALASIEGLKDLAMTTNGVLLGEFAGHLKEAGLRRINVSLDTLDPIRFRYITGFGELRDVLTGLRRACTLKFDPIKLNVVVIRGLNDSELSDFARVTYEYPYFVRFIEFMPIGNRGLWTKERVVSVPEMKVRLKDLGPLEPIHPAPHEVTSVNPGCGVNEKMGVGPAVYFRLKGAVGYLGFISPLSNNFCAKCNRLRLSADGRLRSCLYSDTYIDLKSILRSPPAHFGGRKEELCQALIGAIYGKPQGHMIRLPKNRDTSHLGCVPFFGAMSEIGG